MEFRITAAKLAERIESVLALASKAMSVIAAIVLAAMMLLTVADVTGRYFFSQPIIGAFELVGLLLIFAGTWGWGYCQREKGHVMVTLLIDRLPHMIKIGLNVLNYLIGFTGFSLICWRMCLRTMQYFSKPIGGLTDTLLIPYYPFMLSMAIGAAMMALILLIDLVHSLAEAVRK